MNYPSNIEEKLGFDVIRDKVRRLCLSPMGMGFVDKMRFTSNYENITLWLRQTDEFIKILQAENNFPAENYIDVTGYFKHLDIEGYFLLEHQLHDIRLSLSTFGKVVKFFELKKDRYPQLADIFKDVNFDDGIIRKIDRVLDKDGTIKSSASHELLDIEAGLVSVNRELQKRINSIFKRAKSEGWAAETDISIRDGRFVVPIVAEHKRKIPGLVHDESATGHVYYIEPSEVLELNNQLRELQIDRRREIERILKQVTAEITPYVPELTAYFQKLGIIDFIRAKGSFANGINAVVPKVENKTAFDWRNAFHPLLWMNHKAAGLDVVPLSLSMNPEQRIMIISGPNAGGKSVALKTVGLLQYMIQSGVPVPLHEKSMMGMFQQVFIDIGDEQSLDNDLSTYSSHLTNLKHFVNFSDKKTLFLIDEMGTGTDPQFGGPMAEAVMEELNDKRAYGIITTHFSNLKLLANNTQGMVNASMAYDTEHLKPLFRLETGKPGSSFAFEVAEKIGLNKKIIDKARRKVGSKQKNVDELIVQLEKDQNEVNELKISLAQKQGHVDKLMTDYAQLKKDIEDKKKEILRNAKEQAVGIIDESNRVIESAIRTIKEHKADKEKTEKAREKVEKVKDKLVGEIENEKVEVLAGTDFKTGDTVRIKGQLVSGEVISVTKSKALVAYGNIRSTIETKRLEKISLKEAKKLKEAFKGYDMNEKMAEFKAELDLRGKRGEEALKETLNYIDSAVILGFERFRIVHGKGDGILRRLLRENLKKLPFVESVVDEHVDLGGQGVSIVTLK